MRLRAVAVCVLAIPSVVLCGCGNRLTTRKLNKMFSEGQKEAEANHYRPYVSSLMFQVGDLNAVPYGEDHCSHDSERPPEFDKEEELAREGLISLERTDPCMWRATIAPKYKAELSGNDVISPKPGEYKFVILPLNERTETHAEHVEQNGLHAEVQLKAIYPFTEAGRARVKDGKFDDLDMPGCEYDLPTSSVICKEDVPFAYFDNRWQRDPSRKLQPVGSR